MADKKYDFSDFDEPKTEAPKQEQQFDFSDFDEPKAEPVAEVEEPKKMGRAEAAAISFGQGTSMGLAPIASGAVGLTGEFLSDVGDEIGVTTDAKLRSGISTDELPGLSPKLREKLKGQTHSFDVQDKEAGLSGLLDAYYSSRDAQKRAQNTAFEEYPVQSIVANVAGAIPTTIATAGLGQSANAGRLANVASKVLPNAKTAQVFQSGSKIANYGNKIATGMREGAKAGALTGFGNGDAKLAEGEIGDTLKEVAESSTGGALMGGLVPAVLEPTKAVVKGAAGLIPGLEGIKTAFKGGAAGMSLDEDSANETIKRHSESLLNAIRSKFKEAGMEKASALEYADEIGLRVDAGETFDDVMDDILQRKKPSPEAAEEFKKLYNTLKTLKDGPEDKLQNKLDTARAKMTDKMEQKGYELLDETNAQSHVQDFVPGSEANAKIGTAKQTFQKLSDEGDDLLGSQTPASKPVEKILQASENQSPFDITKYDLKNLSLSDLEDVLAEVNRHTGDLKTQAKTQAEAQARQLAGQLRAMSEEAMETAGKTSGNKNMHNIFNALREMGIKDNVMTNSVPRKNDMVNTLQRLTRGSDDIKTDQVFEYLKKADPEKFGNYEQTSKFLNKFRNIAVQNKDLQSSSWRGIGGGIMNKANVIANKAGGVVHPVAEAGKKFYNTSAEGLLKLAERAGLEKSSASFAGPLKTAATADERKRAAILYGLYQQPAFREMYQSLGDSTIEGVGEMLPDTNKE